jgi:hypothetical protein
VQINYAIAKQRHQFALKLIPEMLLVSLMAMSVGGSITSQSK